MALSASIDQVDENGRELLSYGTPPFPIAFFDDDLSVVSVPYRCFRREYGKTPSEYLRPQNPPLRLAF